MTMVLAPEKKAVVKKQHEPRGCSHGDSGKLETDLPQMLRHLPRRKTHTKKQQQYQK